MITVDDAGGVLPEPDRGARHHSNVLLASNCIGNDACRDRAPVNAPGATTLCREIVARDRNPFVAPWARLRSRQGTRRREPGADNGEGFRRKYQVPSGQLGRPNLSAGARASHDRWAWVPFHLTDASTMSTFWLVLLRRGRELRDEPVTRPQISTRLQRRDERRRI